MSQRIDIAITPESRDLIARLHAFPGLVPKAIQRGLDFAGKYAVDKIGQERFTGKGPFPVPEGRLGVKTGRLRASLRWSPAVIDGGTVRGAMGSNVIYFGIHEYGFDGQVHVSSFTRHVSPSQFGKAIPKSARKSKAKRRAALGTEAVRAHTRWMSMPARAPLGHGIADHVGDFTASIDSALRATWKGVQP